MEQRNPWKKLSQKYVFELAPFIKVRRDSVIQPGGKKGLYAVVERSDSVITVARQKNNNLLLVRQWRYAANFNSWEVPMGSVDKGEDPAQTASRELKEETGFTAQKITKIGEFFPASALANNRAHVFLAEDLIKGDSHLESAEADLVVAEHSFLEIKKMIIEGKIKDAFTITALWYYQQALAEEVKDFNN